MCTYRNLPKIVPLSKISPPPFLYEVVAKDAFLSKIPPTYLCCSKCTPKLNVDLSFGRSSEMNYN